MNIRFHNLPEPSKANPRMIRSFGENGGDNFEYTDEDSCHGSSKRIVTVGSVFILWKGEKGRYGGDLYVVTGGRYYQPYADERFVFVAKMIRYVPPRGVGYSFENEVNGYEVVSTLPAYSQYQKWTDDEKLRVCELAVEYAMKSKFDRALERLADWAKCRAVRWIAVAGIVLLMAVAGLFVASIL